MFKLTRSGAGRTNVQPLMLKRSPKLLRPWGFLSLIFFCETGKTEKSEGKNVVPPVAGSDAPVVFQIGEMRLELPPTPETYAFLERQLRGILPTAERLPAPSQEDAGGRSV